MRIKRPGAEVLFGGGCITKAIFLGGLVGVVYFGGKAVNYKMESDMGQEGPPAHADSDMEMNGQVTASDYPCVPLVDSLDNGLSQNPTGNFIDRDGNLCSIPRLPQR